jgi:hypothetical protein
VATPRAKYRALAPALTERTLRVWAATKARALGRGGPGLVAQATGLSPATIRRGLTELEADDAPLPVDRVRKRGGGRKRATVLAPRCCAILTRSSSRRRRAIRSRRCAGRA